MTRLVNPCNIAALAVILTAYLMTRSTQLALVLGMVNVVVLYASAEFMRRRQKTPAATAAATAPAATEPGQTPASTTAAA